MNHKKTTYVHIGKIEIGQGQDVLAAILGSCVGISLFCEIKKIYCLSHCLLANEVEITNLELPGRHVPNAISFMIKELKAIGIEKKRLQAAIVGGASIVEDSLTSTNYNVGQTNVITAKKILEILAIPLYLEDTGGTIGKRIEIDCAKGKIQSIDINRT